MSFGWLYTFDATVKLQNGDKKRIELEIEAYSLKDAFAVYHQTLDKEFGKDQYLILSCYNSRCYRPN